MGRVTGSWERPIQGVSQQSDKDRIDGQCTKQENLIPSPLDGLIKRTGTRHLKKLMDSVSTDSLWYSYNRGGEESYVILVEPNKTPRVFDILGNERTVNVTSGDTSYYQSANPKRDLRMSTIADYTFLLNTTKTVTELPDKSPKNPDTAIVYCQFATYARDYIIEAEGIQIAKYTTPLGDDPSHANNVKTNFIAETLANQVNSISFATENHSAIPVGSPTTHYEFTTSSTPSKIISVFNLSSNVNVTFTNVGNIIRVTSGTSAGDVLRITYEHTGSSNYTAEVHGNTIFITSKSGGSFSINTVDSADGNDLVAIQDRVKQTTNLPPYAPDNYIVKVQNAEGFEQNSYWLKAVPDTGSDQEGSGVKWEESLAQDVTYKMNKNTLPHTLVSEADGTFTLSLGEWEDRRVGNEDTNPYPSFIDQKISSIGTFQNRVLFTSGEAAVFSRTNFFFDFFRETTQTESDSDPIDAFADADEINNLLHHAVLDGDIIFFAENGQFLIDGSKPITKATIIFKKVTSYPMNTLAKPAVTGESVMFSFISGKYTGIREMFTDSFTDTKRARPITEHVAEYIEGRAVDLVASPNINTLFIRTDTSANELYVYDWLWSGDQKVQAAMHKWIIGGSVLFAKFIQDRVYFIIDRGNGIYLEQMPIGNDEDDNGLDFPVRLDQRTVTTATWSGGRWEWTLPYSITDTDKLVFVRGEGCWEEDRGTSVIFETDGTKYWSYDDLADTLQVQSVSLNAGTTFTSKYIPTKPYLKDGNGRAMGLDRFTLGKVSMNYDSIGNTDVSVTDRRSRRTWKYNYNGRVFGGWNNRVGFAPLDSGRFQFPIRLESSNAEIEIVTDDYRPFILRDMEWEGMFKQRGRRL
ncbi:hypothetical protein PODOV006v2_p0045 [Vibrio phage 15E36.1]|uniref:Tail tubular protein B n=1 Tax=Vibrio phage 15E36.1 TaxID=2859290 RepID=A0AAE7Y015_9CAUD|nr:hypothetical protein PODOV006v2_p0045 [Vibrio phage 15E36.1]